MTDDTTKTLAEDVRSVRLRLSENLAQQLGEAWRVDNEVKDSAAVAVRADFEDGLHVVLVVLPGSVYVAVRRDIVETEVPLAGMRVREWLTPVVPTVYTLKEPEDMVVAARKALQRQLQQVEAVYAALCMTIVSRTPAGSA